MPHLQTLDGKPLSWPTLLAMNEAWHAYFGRGYGAPFEEGRWCTCGARGGTRHRHEGVRLVRNYVDASRHHAVDSSRVRGHDVVEKIVRQ